MVIVMALVDGPTLADRIAGGRIMRVEVAMSPEPVLGEPEWVSSLRAPGGSARLPNYDFDPAGRRFLAINVPGVTASASSSESIVIVQNWVEWLNGEVPVG